MIVTWRDTEVTASSLAASVIASLARAPGSRRCDLAGLSRDSVARWLSAAGLDERRQRAQAVASWPPSTTRTWPVM
jgi:hypothetical protein